MAITYKDAHRASDGIRVILDGKTVGHIRRVDGGGWRYFPKGSANAGEIFLLLAACKQSLESA